MGKTVFVIDDEKDLQKILKAKGEEMNLDIKAQHQDIFNVMHRI